MPEITGKQVSSIGFGLMGLTWRPEPTPLPAALTTMRTALTSGATFWNGGEFYGTPTWNSMTILKAYFEKYPQDASRVVLSMKGAVDPITLKPDGSPAGVRRSLDTILAGLGGTKFLDVFECARRDAGVDFRETLETIQKEYVQTGKVGGIALSEVRAETIREAVKYVKVVAVEVEISLWATECLENGVADTCKEFGIPIVAYSPLGRGALTGAWKSWQDIPPNHPVHHLPRFSPTTFPTNNCLLNHLSTLATRKGITTAQLALGWVLALARKPHMPEIVVIPGATTVERVKENCAAVELTEGEMEEIAGLLEGFEVVGGRYPEGALVHT